MRRMRHILSVSILALACVLFMGAGDTTARFNDLGHKLMCNCGCNQILLECNHVGCTMSSGMRDELQAGLDRGDSDDLVLQAFVQKYGATVLSAPTQSGFNVVAWIMPFVALLGGIVLTAVIARKWKFRMQPVGAQNLSEAELDAFRRRVHEETEV